MARNLYQEDDKYQQIVDRLNRNESASTSSIHGGDKSLFHYINNPVEDINYIGNRGGNPYSNTCNLCKRGHPNLRWGGNQ
ncbi:hypothetical protein EPI10_007037 [Gossypium australe]|uniref:Uncharacterized protein n=1 Tax=Gossypium australe TaxID=47621 RepID=A0A5B6WSU9_9ROSI|nr:hypothetical protein EPI10_007037 [Gossypium australe]